MLAVVVSSLVRVLKLVAKVHVFVNNVMILNYMITNSCQLTVLRCVNIRTNN